MLREQLQRFVPVLRLKQEKPFFIAERLLQQFTADWGIVRNKNAIGSLVVCHWVLAIKAPDTLAINGALRGAFLS
jgi:hypothetical protein